MKKLLLFALAAMIGSPVLAQDEIGADVTKYIINAGFDEDLTWNADGSKKGPKVRETRLSDRSIAYVTEDGTLYATVNPSTPKSRPDGRTLEATNGFVGKMKGWDWVSEREGDNCEWVYFGTLPYDLKDQAIPVADDGSTYMIVPARPTEFEGGTGALYLRAGWGGSFSYKQNVNLPCAKYRLEYWTINVNSGTSATATDLSKITCRGEEFKEEGGEALTATEWTKHEFEFTPVSEFTIEFGFKAGDGGSGTTPWVYIDGIKLVKIDDADETEILQSDCYDLISQLEELQSELSDYEGVAVELSNVIFDLEEGAGSSDVEEVRKALADLKEALAKFTALKETIAQLDNLVTKAENLLMETDYPGKEALDEAIKVNQEVLYKGASADIEAAVANMRKAINDYYMSQEASFENPADYTFAVQHPWFVAENAEPTLNSNGTYYFPGLDYEENAYSTGAAPVDGSSDGWYTCGTYTGGDQRLNFQQGRTCWNAWGNNINGTIGIAQDIENLPNGFYKVQADLITQFGYCTDQHTFATSAISTAASPALTRDSWVDNGEGEWETLTTDDAVIVADGKLTIGAIGTGTGEASAGWFLVTNFKLLYCGPATDEQIAEALAGRVAEVKTAVEGMHFAADKAEAQKALAEFDETKNMDKLTEAAKLAETSEGKYNEIMAEGKTIPTVEAGLADGSYGGAAAVAQFALDYVKAYIASDEATYSEVDEKLTEAKVYVETYIPVYQEAELLLGNAKSDLSKEMLSGEMQAQKALLVTEMQDKTTVEKLVESLKTMMYNVAKQERYMNNPDATDYTSFIQNPMAEAETGWKLEYSDGPIKNGQWYTGSNDVRYFDSYNSTDGALRYFGEQVVLGVPNGTYTVGADVRTSGEGAFIFAGNGGELKSDTTWVEIPLQTYTHFDDETGEEVTENATDKWGQIWEDAVERFGSMTDSDPEYYELQAITNANSGSGRGWMHLDVPGIMVKDHKIVIGMAVGEEYTGKAFTGKWFSVGNWTLTLTEKGDNEGWGGPLVTGINEVSNSQKTVADGIYTVSGLRVAKLQRGMNIVVSNGKAVKVLVK